MVSPLLSKVHLSKFPQNLLYLVPLLIILSEKSESSPSERAKVES